MSGLGGCPLHDPFFELPPLRCGVCKWTNNTLAERKKRRRTKLEGCVGYWHNNRPVESKLNYIKQIFQWVVAQCSRAPPMHRPCSATALGWGEGNAVPSTDGWFVIISFRRPIFSITVTVTAGVGVWREGCFLPFFIKRLLKSLLSFIQKSKT